MLLLRPQLQATTQVPSIGHLISLATPEVLPRFLLPTTLWPLRGGREKMNFNPFACTRAMWLLLLLHSHPNHPFSLQPVTYTPSPNAHAQSYDGNNGRVFAFTSVFLKWECSTRSRSSIGSFFGALKKKKKLPPFRCSNRFQTWSVFHKIRQT